MNISEKISCFNNIALDIKRGMVRFENQPNSLPEKMQESLKSSVEKIRGELTRYLLPLRANHSISPRNKPVNHTASFLPDLKNFKKWIKLFLIPS